MTTLLIPPDRTEDVERVKDFLFQSLGSSPWSEADYLAYADRFPRLVELSEGRLVVLDMPTPNHQRIVRRVLKQLDVWAEANGGEVLMAPMPVHLWPGKFREPDVMLYTAANLHRIKAAFGEPPDLVVDVESPGTARLDATERLDEYAQAGIPEYWRMDSNRQQVEVSRLEGDQYVVALRVGVGERLTSSVMPDFDWLVDDLFDAHQ